MCSPLQAPLRIRLRCKSLNRGCARSRSALALSDNGTAGNSERMDVSLGKVPDVTADLIRKAFYPADEHVADAAAADGFSAAGTGGT